MKLTRIISFAIIFVLAACRGGGSGGGETTSSSIISGVAAVGAPIANGKLIVMGNSCEVIGETDSMGQYSVTLSSCEGPYLLRAEGTLGIVHSIATSSDFGKQVSITPISELIAGRVLGSANLRVLNKGDISVSSKDMTIKNITEKKNEIKLLLAPLLIAQGLTSFDLLNSSFSANGEGFDKLLDAIEVAPKSSSEFSFKIKGSQDVLNLSMNPSQIVATVDDLKSISDNSSMIEASSGVLGEIKLLLNSLNSLLLTENSEAKDLLVGSYFHPSYLNSGWTVHTFYGHTQLKNPILLNYNKDSNEADVWITKNETWVLPPGVTEIISYGFHVKFKKHEDKWKFFGNQIPISLESYPSHTMYNENIYRGLFVDIYAAESNNLRIVIDNVLDENVIFGSDGKPIFSRAIPCAATNQNCKNIIHIENQAVLPTFLKLNITIDGQSYQQYAMSPKSNLSTNSFPQFLNLPNESLCGQRDTSNYPLVINFSLPTDHSLDKIGGLSGELDGGLVFYPSTSFEDFELFKKYSVSILDTDGNPYSGPISVNKAEIHVDSYDKVGSWYQTIYSCVAN